MNVCKFYRTMENGTRRTLKIRVTQRQREINREVRCKPSLLHPDGWKSIPPKYPTVAMARAMAAKQGYFA